MILLLACPNFSHHRSHAKAIPLLVITSSETQNKVSTIVKIEKLKHRKFLALRVWGS